jgi:hypothetical protein
MTEKRDGRAVELRLRWPPFDPETVIASALPVAAERFRLTDAATAPCAVHIGDPAGFHVSRVIITTPPDMTDFLDWKTQTHRVPHRIVRERTGWFITPNPTHRLSRRLIRFAVIGIIASLLVHAFEPALVEWGIVEGSFAGSVRLGLLDYPVLLLIFLPFFFFPIAMRVFASIYDFRRTRRFRANAPQSPIFTLEGDARTAEPLAVSIAFPEVLEDWTGAAARVQVGLLNPRRPMWLHALGRSEGDQNPPGVSTPLSIHQYSNAELGVGFGEATPLQGPDAERLFLAPLPVLSRGQMVEVALDGATVSLPPPKGDWPGSEYHPLFATHWEILLRIERERDGPLIFVEHVLMEHDGSVCAIAEMPVQSGRSELADS